MDNTLLSHNAYRSISRKVHSILNSCSWMQLHGYEFITFFLRVFGFVSGFIIFMQVAVIFKIVGIIIMSYCYSGIVITGIHETSHESFFKSKRMNKITAYFFSDFLVGQSNKWWRQSHVEVHHAETNIKNKDPPLPTIGWINKYIYFFIIPYFIGLWFIYNSIIFLAKKPFQLMIYLTLMILGYALNIYLFTLVLPLQQAIIAMLIMRFLFAPMFMHIAIFNHIALEEPIKKYPWIKHQARTTRNLSNNWFIRGFGGNAFVDAHLEHHLFQRLSNHLLSKIKPLVQETLTKEKLKYVEEGYWRVLGRCLKQYDSYFKSKN